ncbi:MAG: DUF559 domain-containing protein [Dokdonella sp.]|uniref:endonuclease domain-containing protein n=1 Tax=Dokdonella sp. TaxID=2291710 RepID=UPI003BAF624E
MADGKHIATARKLRTTMTDAERRLWSRLRDRRLGGFKFRRQVPIAGFVADFACLDANLIVEVDGGQHVDEAESDLQRTRKLDELGFRVVRFWNDDVLIRTDDVLEAIRLALSGESASL